MGKAQKEGIKTIARTVGVNAKEVEKFVVHEFENKTTAEHHREDLYGKILQWQNKSVPKSIKEDDFPEELRKAAHSIFPSAGDDH